MSPAATSPLPARTGVVAALEIASGVTITARRKNLFMLHPDPQIIPGAEDSPNF
jgi:hypothetical protein